MISNYKAITGKYLKANKKRTILTILGIVLSVALISSIWLFFRAMINSEEDSMRTSVGAYHIVFSNLDDSTVSKIVNNGKVSRSGFILEGDMVKLNEKLNIQEIKATDNALELMPYKTKEGKFPSTSGEVAVENWILKYIDPKAMVGSNIKINNKEYKLVGILENSVNSQMNSSGLILYKDSNLDKSKAKLLVELGDKSQLRKTLNQLEALTDKKNYQENSYLLTVQGAGNESYNNAYYSVMAVVMAIVIIVTIAVIYNSFQISVVERIKQFGLLRAVGSTPKQIRRIVLREASILAIIGVPIGLVSGCIAIGGIYIAFNLIGGSNLNFIKLDFSPMVFLWCALLGLAAIYASAMVPAYFAGRTSPLVAISGSNNIKKEKYKKRKNLIVNKIFGFEGTLAEKNMKRSRKRYRITVFSIVISVALFITFKSFMDMSLHVADSNNETSKVNYSIANSNEKIKTDFVKMKKEVSNLSFVKESYYSYNIFSFKGLINKAEEVSMVQNIKGVYENSKYQGKDFSAIKVNIAILDENNMKAVNAYLQSGILDFEKMNKENGVMVVGNNKIDDLQKKKAYVGPMTKLGVGDDILLQSNEEDKKIDQGIVNSVKVEGVLKEDPYASFKTNDILTIVTTKQVAEKLVNRGEINAYKLNIILNNVKDENKATKELEKIVGEDSSLRLVNYIDENRKSGSSVLMVEILLYGFVIVVSLIGSVNIINTLTTNIILRRREFAILKSIGLTQKGLRKMIILEGMLYGIMGSIYGSIVGTGLSYLLYSSFTYIREFSFSIPWNAIGIATFFALLIGYLSVLSPIRRINKDNLIDTVREEY